MERVAAVVDEWRKGCSVSLEGAASPEECETCTRGAIDAIAAVVAPEMARKLEDARSTIVCVRQPPSVGTLDFLEDGSVRITAEADFAMQAGDRVYLSRSK